MTEIVDITGLAGVLSCSKSNILKTWRQYPHFFVGTGNSAKGARFDINDVLGYLKNRDYASLGQENEQLQGKGADRWAPPDNKDWVLNKGRRKAVGTKRETRPEKQPTDPNIHARFILSGIQ